METELPEGVIRLFLKYWEYHRHTDALKLPMHSHLFWQLNLAESGDATFFADEQVEYKLHAGDLLFVPPRVSHLLRYGNTAFVGFSFKFEIRGMNGNGITPIHIQSSRETRGCINAIRELLTATFPSDYIFNGENLICDDASYNTILVESLLLGLFSRYVLGGAGHHETPLLLHVRKLLRQRHGCPLPVGELAKSCGYSAGYLSELIRKECGFSAKGLIDRERARIAAHFLEFSDMRIGEIAEYMGFPNLFSFSNFFHLHFGCTPSSYRRESRKELDASTGPAVQNP